MDYTIIPTGEKIKTLREKYKLNQDEIVGNDITRNLISQIENGKAKLTQNTAEVIMTHVKEKLKKKGMTLDISIDYLLEDEEAQAKIILDNSIAELEELLKNNDINFNDTLKQVEEFLLKFDFVDKKVKIYELAADYFFQNNYFYKALVYYESVRRHINLNMDIVQLISVLIKLSKTYYYMGKYQDGIDVCKYALDRFPELDSYSKTIFLFNICLYFNYLKQYDNALEYIYILEPDVDTKVKDIEAKIRLLKASCLYNLKRYEESLVSYKELLDNTQKNDYGNKSIYYSNLAEIYIDMENHEEAKKYLNMVLNDISSIPEDYECLPQLYLEIGRRYIKLNYQQKAVAYLKKSLELAKQFKYAFVISDALIELMKCIQEKTEVDIKKEFLDLTSNYKEVNNILLINTLKYFSSLNDNETVQYICDNYLKSI
ncbi:helix-turn-helix transcriptional regulator [Clostridium sp. 19966]|uniref:transcriptional regulator n=1 Tax=Clostridium sp. 19966 TaxID=2768166 RepID=UPI0028DE3601|nr:transcriptional regulator [Clostridium sp. 19966]MDT8718258.1 helix-turn-helix transcriptional regulator [Clostridium sp. 19966]